MERVFEGLRCQPSAKGEGQLGFASTGSAQNRNDHNVLTWKLEPKFRWA